MRKKMFFLVLCIVFVSVLVGCDTCSPSCDESMPNAKTSENWSYIDLQGKPGYPGDYTNLIGSEILRWEQNNPDRSIVSMQIFYQQKAHTTDRKLLGISIYSKLTQK